MRAVRWTKPAHIHLTLQFLGDVPVGRVDAIVDALNQTAPSVAAFDLSPAGVGAFPGLKRPRIIWVGVASSAAEAPASLHRAVIRATQTVGFTPEARPFSPHLTIGRVQKWAGKTDYARIADIITRTPIESVGGFTVRRISLVRSQLKPTGPVYTTLAEVPMGD